VHRIALVVDSGRARATRRLVRWVVALRRIFHEGSKVALPVDGVRIAGEDGRGTPARTGSGQRGATPQRSKRCCRSSWSHSLSSRSGHAWARRLVLTVDALGARALMGLDQLVAR